MQFSSQICRVDPRCRYDLLNHNCNNFSHETCQFLTGKGIPQHILDLPREVMSTPMGQMLAPMLQQMNPTGTSIPFSQGPPSAASMQPPTPASTAKLFPVSDFITFDAPLKVEGLAKKLDEFNTAQESDTKLSEEEVKVVLGIARGVVRLSKENLAILMKMQKWQTSQAFPLLDILRAKCVKPTFDPPELISQVVDLMLESLQPDHAVNSMLACKALSNLVAAGHPLSVEKVLSLLPALLPAASNNLETALASLLSNLSVALVSKPTLESAVLLASSLASSIMLDLTQVSYRQSFNYMFALNGLIILSSHRMSPFTAAWSAWVTHSMLPMLKRRFVSCSSLWTPVIWSVVASPGEERSQLQLLKSSRCSNQETTSTWTDAPATHFTVEIYKIPMEVGQHCWMENIPT